MPNDDPNDFRLSDYLSGPTASILIPAISGLAGMTRPIPGRFGTRRAGLSGLVEGGLTGLNLVSGMQEQKRKLGDDRKLSQLLGDKGYFAEQIPTGKTLSREIPTGEFGSTKETESEDFPIGNVPQTRTETTPETAPRMDIGKRKMLGALPPSVQATTLGTILAREKEKPQIFGGTETGYYALPHGEAKAQPLVPGVPTKVSFAEQENRLRRAGEIAAMELPTERRRAMIASLGLDPVKFLGAEEKTPPALDDNLVDQGLADLAAGQPISRRVMQAFGSSDPDDIKSRLLARNQIRQERKTQEKTDAMDIALTKTNRELAMQPMQGMVLNADSGEPVNITKGDYAQSPKSYLRLTPGQERMKAGLDTAKTHMVVTSQFVNELPKSGLRITNILGQKISQLENDPTALSLFQQLHSMTSLAVGSALVSGGGGRPGVRLAQFMAPAGVTEGDTFAVAVKKMGNWMNIVSRNAKEAGLPAASYDKATNEMNLNIMKGLIREAGSVEGAKKLAKQYGLGL